VSDIKKECLLLKEKIKELTASLATFTRGEEGLNKLLGQPSFGSEKADLRFNFSNKRKAEETLSLQPCASILYNTKAHVKQISNSFKKTFVKGSIKPFVKYSNET